MNSLNNQQVDFKHTLSELYTEDIISRMVADFEDSHNVNFSDEIFDNLEWSNEDYIIRALEIQNAITLFEEKSWKKYNYNPEPLENNIDDSQRLELVNGMHNTSQSIMANIAANEEIEEYNKSIKGKIASLLNIFKK